jgi:nuclear GTP-binding protein
MGKSSNKKNQSGKHQKYKQSKKAACEPQHKISKSEKIKERRKGQKVAEIKKKDLGVPNRNVLLKGMEGQKQKISKEKMQDILDRKRAQEKAKIAAIPQSLQMAALKASAANRLATFDMHVDELDLGSAHASSAAKVGDVEHTRRAFYRELHKILETADVILEVVQTLISHGRTIDCARLRKAQRP